MMTPLLPLRAVRLMFGTGTPRIRPTCQTARLSAEALEERYLLANLLWIGGTFGDWSDNTMQNWIDIDTGVKQNAVAVNDSLTFNPNLVVGTTQGANTVSIDNIIGLTIANFVVAFTYGKTIVLPNGLTANGVVSLASTAGAVITMDATGLMSITGPNSMFTWTGGTISAGTLQLSAQTPTTITDTNTKTMETLVFNNSGPLSWSGGNIDIGISAINNRSGGTFDIQFDGNITGAGGAIVNNDMATFKKSGGTGTSAIAPSFENDGVFQLNSGLVNLTSTTTKQLSGTTTLNGGNLQVATIYFVAAGLLEGVGTIFGNVSTDKPDLMGNGTGTVHPGIGNAPGNLNVAGNYTQTSGGNLKIDINATGTIGLLNMAARPGGQATLAGTVTVTRNTAYQPAIDGLTLTFMRYLSLTPDFGTRNIVNSSWTVGGSTYELQYVLPAGTTTYQVKVQKLQCGSGKSPRTAEQTPSRLAAKDITNLDDMMLFSVTPGLSALSGAGGDYVNPTVRNDHVAGLWTRATPSLSAASINGVLTKAQAGERHVWSLIANDWASESEALFARMAVENGLKPVLVS